MARELPFYQRAQLKNLLVDIKRLAAEKRLEAIFDVELFAVERNVAAALALGSDEAGQAALREARQLMTQLKAAPDKSGGSLLVR